MVTIWMLSVLPCVVYCSAGSHITASMKLSTPEASSTDKSFVELILTPEVLSSSAKQNQNVGTSAMVPQVTVLPQFTIPMYPQISPHMFNPIYSAATNQIFSPISPYAHQPVTSLSHPPMMYMQPPILSHIQPQMTPYMQPPITPYGQSYPISSLHGFSPVRGVMPIPSLALPLQSPRSIPLPAPVGGTVVSGSALPSTTTPAAAPHTIRPAANLSVSVPAVIPANSTKANSTFPVPVDISSNAANDSSELSTIFSISSNTSSSLPIKAGASNASNQIESKVIDSKAGSVSTILSNNSKTSQDPPVNDMESLLTNYVDIFDEDSDDNLESSFTSDHSTHKNFAHGNLLPENNLKQTSKVDIKMKKDQVDRSLPKYSRYFEHYGGSSSPHKFPGLPYRSSKYPSGFSPDNGATRGRIMKKKRNDHGKNSRNIAIPPFAPVGMNFHRGGHGYSTNEKPKHWNPDFAHDFDSPPLLKRHHTTDTPRLRQWQNAEEKIPFSHDVFQRNSDHKNHEYYQVPSNFDTMSGETESSTILSRNPTIRLDSVTRTPENQKLLSSRSDGINSPYAHENGLSNGYLKRYLSENRAKTNSKKRGNRLGSSIPSDTRQTFGIGSSPSYGNVGHYSKSSYETSNPGISRGRILPDQPAARGRWDYGPMNHSFDNSVATYEADVPEPSNQKRDFELPSKIYRENSHHEVASDIIDTGVGNAYDTLSENDRAPLATGKIITDSGYEAELDSEEEQDHSVGVHSNEQATMSTDPRQLLLTNGENVTRVLVSLRY